MAFTLGDRVRETTAVVGVGALTLLGAVQGHQSVSSIMSTGDTSWFTVAGGSEWETGEYTRNSDGTLTRTTVLASSNGGSAVSFSSGQKDVFMDVPASRLTFLRTVSFASNVITLSSVLNIGPSVVPQNKCQLLVNGNTVIPPSWTNGAGEIWRVHVSGADSEPTNIGIDSYGTGAFSVLDVRHARGTASAPLRLETDDIIGVIGFIGAKDDGLGGTNYGNGLQIRGYAQAAYTSTSTPSYGELRTIAVGATTTTPTVRWASNGIWHYYTTTPAANDGAALGTGALSWSDLFLASGAVINFNAGDVTITHSSNLLAFGGASTGYTFDAGIYPASDDGAAIGGASTRWSDLFLASGAVINFNNGNYTLTHSAGLLTASGVIAFAGGSVSAPGLSVSGDSNTGIYALAGDNVAMSAGGLSEINVLDTTPATLAQVANRTTGNTANTAELNWALNNSSQAVARAALFRASLSTITAGAETGLLILQVRSAGTLTEVMRFVPTLVTLGVALSYGGVTLSNSVTGTGSMVLATSPTITGGTHVGAGKVTSWFGGYVAGRYYIPPNASNINVNTVALAANTVYYCPFIVGETHTFDRIAVEVTATGTATLVRLAIYNAAGGIPTSLVVDGGTVSVAGTGTKTVTISQSLTPGVYWLAVVSDGTVTIEGTNAAQVIHTYTGLSSFTAPDTQVNAALTFGAFPGTAGAVSYTNAAMPTVALRA